MSSGGAEEVVPRAIVVGHASFSDGIVSAVDQITGRGGMLLPLSNAGLGREEIEAQLREHLARYNVTVIFTDLPGGSATLAARRVMHDMQTLTLVTGVNLAALIDFVFCDDGTSPADAARHAVGKGCAALTVTTGTSSTS
jgi:PTS system N-acetylgalactosamine-specific IIA component